MASPSSTISVFDAHHFRTAHDEQLFESYARRRKVISEAGFNLEDDEYPEIMEQIAIRGWRRLAAPRMDISKLLVQEFYANAVVSDEEAAAQEEHPYKSFVRGKEIDFSPNNIRRVMRFKREIAGALTDYKTRQALNQRLDEVLADLCILGASWKLSSSQPPVPFQLRMTELQPLARAQGLGNKGNLAHPSTIYKLCKDVGVPLREFARTPRIPSLSYITAKRIETISMQFFQQTFYENIQKFQADYMEEVKQIKEKHEQIYQQNQRFHSQVWKEQEKLAKEVQDIWRGQMTQVAVNTQRFEAERNLQLALERQGRDIAEIRRQVNLWNNNVSSKEAYA
ncbi:hypothetical protein PIB30_061884 [Stylosanthes scabra]|uniref:Putative plant transposon protein domain-containing protein n=1 Tax=Stylosanthes scabra TaxID=79078 RepID=A0ABU6TLX4_9FABA|nr:hypothetical protein [Stylosanthes scabra]